MSRSLKVFALAVLVLAVLEPASARCPVWSVVQMKFKVLSCEEVPGHGLRLEIRALSWKEVEKGAGLGSLGTDNFEPPVKRVLYANAEIDCSSVEVGKNASGRAQSRCCDGGGECATGVADLYTFRQNGV